MKKTELYPHQVSQPYAEASSRSHRWSFQSVLRLPGAAQGLHTDISSSCVLGPLHTEGLGLLLQALLDPQQLQKGGALNLGTKTAAVKLTPRVHHVQQFQLLQPKPTAAHRQAAALVNR